MCEKFNVKAKIIDKTTLQISCNIGNSEPTDYIITKELKKLSTGRTIRAYSYGYTKDTPLETFIVGQDGKTDVETIKLLIYEGMTGAAIPRYVYEILEEFAKD